MAWPLLLMAPLTDTGSNPIIDDKEVQEEGQYTLQASLDTGLPVAELWCQELSSV